MDSFCFSQVPVASKCKMPKSHRSCHLLNIASFLPPPNTVRVRNSQYRPSSSEGKITPMTRLAPLSQKQIYPDRSTE